MSRRTAWLAGLAVAALVVVPAAGQQQGETPERPPAAATPTSPDALEANLDALLDAEAEAAAETAGGLTTQDLYDVAGLALVLGLALASFLGKSRALKYATMVLSIGYLGFVKANLVSIVNIFGIIRGNLPDVAISLPWYLMIGFTAVSTVLWGRLYCGHICAFGALTQLMDTIVPARLRIDPPARFDRRAVFLKYGVLGAAILYFLVTGNLLVYRYIEPFWMFTLNGTVVMWSMLAVLLLATVFVRNLYCRYLCSVGATQGLLSNLTMFRIKRWGECTTCTICERACEWGAIDGPRIAVSECVRCDDCERIYRDKATCVHWIVLERRRPGGQATGARADRSPVVATGR